MRKLGVCCKNCESYDPDPECRMNNYEAGFCRRNSPLPFGDAWKNGPWVFDSDRVIFHQWPRVRGFVDYCDDFKPASDGVEDCGTTSGPH